LGDIVDPFEYANADECESAFQKWLEKARTSDLAKNRVDDLEKQVAVAAEKRLRRDTYKEKKLIALKTVEEDKLDMYDEILIRVRGRISGGGTTGGGLGGGSRSSSSSSSGGTSGMSSSSSSGSR
jgi:hypothetical protein